MGWDPFKDIKKIAGKVVREVSRVADDLTGINFLGKSMPVSTAGTLLQGTVQAATQAAGATTAAQVFPGVAVPVELDVPTASYLETQEYLAQQRQKALVKGITSSGFVSKQQGREMAGPPATKPINFSLIVIIAVIIWGLKL